MNSTIQRFRDKVEYLIQLMKETSDEEEDDESDEDDTTSSDDDEKEDEEEEEEEEEDDGEEDDGEEDDGEEEDEEEEDEEEEDDEDYTQADIENEDDDYDIIANTWDDIDKSVYVLTEQEPNTLQIFSHKPYFYLSDAQTRLSPEVDILNSDPIEYALYIYIVCNNTNFDPYLACLLKYDEASKSYAFPKIIYDPISLKEGDTHDIYIQNMCYEIIYPLFQIDETQVTSEFIENTKDCFKGSIYYDGMKCGILGFNAEKFIRFLKGKYKTLSEHFHKKTRVPSYTWACLHEIMISKRVHNISVHPDVRDTFSEYEWLREIKNERNENTEKPKMLYSCTIQDNKVSNSLTDLEKTKYLPPVSYHPVLERVRFFTDEMDEISSAKPFQMPRYIVFMGEVKVIEIDNKTDLVSDFKKEKLRITSVQFKQENRTIYGVFSCDCIYCF